MTPTEFNDLTKKLKGQPVERPNRSSSGTLSGHAAGEPFEKLAYKLLKKTYPAQIFKQYEYLNDLYRTHPKNITLSDRRALFDSPVALFLLSRSDSATRAWNPNHIFEEKQNDTADILWHDNGYFQIIDVKTRNMSIDGQPPNIISAYKLAQACALMIDNEDYDSVGIFYVEVEWKEVGGELRCTNAHWRDLFKASPDSLYINWAAALQIQFHVSKLNQSFSGTKKTWAREYIRKFVNSAEHRCAKMYEEYVIPFKKYLEDDYSPTLF